MYKASSRQKATSIFLLFLPISSNVSLFCCVNPHIVLAASKSRTHTITHNHRMPFSNRVYADLSLTIFESLAFLLKNFRSAHRIAFSFIQQNIKRYTLSTSTVLTCAPYALRSFGNRCYCCCRYSTTLLHRQ